MRVISIFLLSFCFACLSGSAMAADIAPKEIVVTEPATSTDWPKVMTAYLSEPNEQGLVQFDYQALVDDETNLQILDNYIAYLEDLKPHLMCRESALGYWANLYNALTVKVIAENYPVRSIKKIKTKAYPRGPWKTDVARVDYEELSLDDIEHKKMRQHFPTPMVHYMVNCASVSCPNLKAGEWVRKTLKDDLDAAARAYVNSPRGVQITKRGLKISKIYKWYRKDFGPDKDAVLQHIRKYADEDLAVTIDGGAIIVGYHYDWNLNDI